MFIKSALRLKMNILPAPQYLWYIVAITAGVEGFPDSDLCKRERSHGEEE
jgi:hypothetical protein